MGITLAAIVGACLKQASEAPTPTRWRWWLYTLYQILLFGSICISIFASVAPQYNYLFPILVRPFTMLSVVAILVAITGSFGREDSSSVQWIDLSLVSIITFLFLVLTLSASVRYGRGVYIVRIYDILIIFRATCAIIQFIASVEQKERYFFYFIIMQTWIGGAALSIHNHIRKYAMANYIDMGLLFIDLFTICLLYFPAPQWIGRYVPSARTARIAQASGPCLMGLTAVMLSLGIFRIHPYLGTASMVCSVLLYGLRNGLIQSKLLETKETLLDTQSKLESLSLKDGLTGVANRRCFDQTLESEWNRAVRVTQPLSLLLIDVDLFKGLNDRYGHRSGDDCLVQIAGALSSVLPRSGDLLARYGGEEFAVILPVTDQEGACTVAANMQLAVNALCIPNETVIGQFVTISIGSATYAFPNENSPRMLVEASDRALYRAKERGRNRVEFMLKA